MSTLGHTAEMSGLFVIAGMAHEPELPEQFVQKLNDWATVPCIENKPIIEATINVTPNDRQWFLVRPGKGRKTVSQAVLWTVVFPICRYINILLVDHTPRH
jgi:hypothetical protein